MSSHPRPHGPARETSTPDPGGEAIRPPCFHCGQAYASSDTARHTEPAGCDRCPGCRGMPACYTCRNMYCPCELHQG